MKDILLVEGNNQLNVQIVPIAAPAAEIISISVSPTSIPTGSSFTVTVRWRNTGSVGYAFDIVGAYGQWAGQYPGSMEYYAGAVYDIFAAPGEEKVTVVTVPTYKGDIGTFDVWVQIADAKKPYPFIEKSYAVKNLDNGVRIA